MISRDGRVLGAIARFGPSVLIATLMLCCLVDPTRAVAVAPPRTPKVDRTTLRGEGSTLALNYVQASIGAFRRRQHNVTMTYVATGAPRGAQDLVAGKVDFAGVDGALDPDATASGPRGALLYFPMVVSSISVVFNVPGVHDLRLSPETIAQIFQGGISRWDSPVIKADNPDATLPRLPLVVAHPAEPSGTTQNFSTFLSLAAPSSWASRSGPVLQWPANATGGAGDLGVAQIVKTTPGAIGYVDDANARALELDEASVKNANGEYIAPSRDASAAALEVVLANSDLTFDAMNVAQSGAYPIIVGSWLVVDSLQLDRTKAAALRAFLRFVYSAGAPTADQVNSASPMPEVVALARAQIPLITAP